MQGDWPILKKGLFGNIYFCKNRRNPIKNKQEYKPLRMDWIAPPPPPTSLPFFSIPCHNALSPRAPLLLLEAHRYAMFPDAYSLAHIYLCSRGGLFIDRLFYFSPRTFSPSFSFSLSVVVFGAATFFFFFLPGPFPSSFYSC